MPGRPPRVGNMHGVPLVYFRTTEALNIDTFAQVPSMVGQKRAALHLSAVLSGSFRGLVFAYRDGASGNGNYIFNTYDVAHPAAGRAQSTRPFCTGRGCTAPIRWARSWGPTAGIIWSGLARHARRSHQPRPLLCEEPDRSIGKTGRRQSADPSHHACAGDIVDPVPAGAA